MFLKNAALCNVSPTSDIFISSWSPSPKLSILCRRSTKVDTSEEEKHKILHGHRKDSLEELNGEGEEGVEDGTKNGEKGLVVEDEAGASALQAAMKRRVSRLLHICIITQACPSFFCTLFSSLVSFCLPCSLSFPGLSLPQPLVSPNRSTTRLLAEIGGWGAIVYSSRKETPTTHDWWQILRDLMSTTS